MQGQIRNIVPHPANQRNGSKWTIKYTYLIVQIWLICRFPFLCSDTCFTTLLPFTHVTLFECQKIIIRNLLLMRLKHLNLLCQSWLVRFVNVARWVCLHTKSIKGINNEKAKDMLHSLHAHTTYLFLMFISATEGTSYDIDF